MRWPLAMVTLSCMLACTGSEAPPEAPAPPPDKPAPTTPDALPEVPTPCAEELAAFEAEIERPILSTLCIGCHVEAGAAADSRLQLTRTEVEGHALMNWKAVGALGMLELDGAPVLLLRASGGHPEGHPGGALLPTTSEAYAALAQFVADARDPTCNLPPEVAPPCTAPPYGPPVLRRLTHAEYRRSLEAAIARPAETGGALVADRVEDGLANQAALLTVTALLADQYRQHAEDLGQEARERLDDVLPCQPTPELAEACKALFISDFGARAFRRPLDDEEILRYVALFDATSDGDFGTGVQWVITAMLQSPHFLYRSEIGAPAQDGTRRLDEYEIASQLSYFLTGGPPDAALLSAAARGALSDPAERMAQARRLLATTVGHDAMVQFFFEWLDLDRLSTVPKAPATFPELTPEVRAAMRKETELFITDVLWRGSGRLPDLLTAPYSFEDPSLAAFYGSTAPADPGFQRTTGDHHVGLLSQGSLLTVHAQANDGSPIHRGKLVRERLLCQPLAPPPPGISVELPPVDPTLTTRERYAAHSEVEPCRSCHRLIDPIGFGFEAYDGIGRPRTEQAGQPVDASGHIESSPNTDGEFEDLRGLATLLADSKDVPECFADRLLRHGYGLSAEAGLSCAKAAAVEAFVSGELRFEALVMALVASPHLSTRAPIGP